MEAISFTARDGQLLHGYLSVPNNSKGKDPMVVIVHGGPYGVRDFWGYDAEVQLLTSHGYAVMQINFRGSDGYGEAFERSGYKQWGLKMQDDITDGTLWAVQNDIADTKKLRAVSPAYHVDKIKAALFLIHGKADKRVPFEHYENLTQSLDRGKYPYEPLLNEDEGHGFVENENQYLLYCKIIKFLDKHLK